VAATQSTLKALHPGYAATVGRFIQNDPLAPARRALDVARIRADPRCKRLSFGRLGPAEAETPEERDVLELLLVPDIPPYAGQYRLVPKGLGAAPNLPRCCSTTTTDSLAALLNDLGVLECAGGNEGEATNLIGGRLYGAMERNGIRMERAGRLLLCCLHATVNSRFCDGKSVQ